MTTTVVLQLNQITSVVQVTRQCMCCIDLELREKTDRESVHIINIDIQDNQEEATIGAFMICDLCTLVRTADVC